MYITPSYQFLIYVLLQCYFVFLPKSDILKPHNNNNNPKTLLILKQSKRKNSTLLVEEANWLSRTVETNYFTTSTEILTYEQN